MQMFFGASWHKHYVVAIDAMFGAEGVAVVSEPSKRRRLFTIGDCICGAATMATHVANVQAGDGFLPRGLMPTASAEA